MLLSHWNRLTDCVEINSHLKITFIYLLCVCVHTQACQQYTCGQRTAWGSWFSPSTACIPGIKFRLSGSVPLPAELSHGPHFCVWEQEDASQNHRHQYLEGTSILTCCSHKFLPKTSTTHNDLDTYQPRAPYKSSRKRGSDFREIQMHLQVLPKPSVFLLSQMGARPSVHGVSLFFRGGAWLTPALDKGSCLRVNALKLLLVVLSQSLPDAWGGHGFSFSGWWWVGTYTGPYLLEG